MKLKEKPAKILDSEEVGRARIFAIMKYAEDMGYDVTIVGADGVIPNNDRFITRRSFGIHYVRYKDSNEAHVADIYPDKIDDEFVRRLFITMDVIGRFVREVCILHGIVPNYGMQGWSLRWESAIVHLMRTSVEFYLVAYLRAHQDCEYCKNQEPMLLDEDGIKTSISDKPGRWAHAYEDGHWACKKPPSNDPYPFPYKFASEMIEDGEAQLCDDEDCEGRLVIDGVCTWCGKEYPKIEGDNPDQINLADGKS